MLLHELVSMNNLHFLEFWYLWRKVRSILWPLHWLLVNGRKLKSASFGRKYPQTSGHRWTWHNEPENCTCDPLKCLWGHLRSRTVSNSFWKHQECVQLNNTNRMTCNMTFSVTLTWGQIFELTFSGQLICYSTRLPDVIFLWPMTSQDGKQGQIVAVYNDKHFIKVTYHLKREREREIPVLTDS